MFKYDENLETRWGLKIISDRIVRKEAAFSRPESLAWLQKLVNHLIANPDSMVVPVFKFEVLEERAQTPSNWGVYKYAYEMMRLPMLDRYEKDAISSILRSRYAINSDNEPPDVVRSRREYPELFKFMVRVLKDGHYTDLHNQNFLKDEEGNYRIIDLEGFSRYPGVGDWRT